MTSSWLRLFLLLLFILLLLFVCLFEFCQGVEGASSSSPSKVKGRQKKQEAKISNKTGQKKDSQKVRQAKAKEKREMDYELLVNTVNSEASGTWEAEKYDWIVKLRERQLLKFFTGVPGNKKGRGTSQDKPASEAERRKKRAIDEGKKWTCMETDEFDVRTKKEWANCHSVFKRIENQGLCGSCWAMAATAVFSDRYCIHNINNATERGKHFSSMDLLTCLQDSNGKFPGCSGATSTLVNNFITEHGVVTSACKPLYKSWSVTNLLLPVRLPTCKQECVKNSGLDYSGDKRKGGNAVRVKCSIHQIKHQLEHNGPVTVIIDAHVDLLFFKKGVYHRIKNPINWRQDDHALRILGWGTQTCTKSGKEPQKHAYWIVANSWSEKWGDHGFFRIRQGECGIESNGMAFISFTDTQEQQQHHGTGVASGSGGGGADPKSKKESGSRPASVKSQRSSDSLAIRPVLHEKKP